MRLLGSSTCNSPVVTLGTTTFTTRNYSAHTSVFMCFVWLSEQTAIISLYNINRLFFFYNRDRMFTARYGQTIYISGSPEFF